MCISHGTLILCASLNFYYIRGDVGKMPSSKTTRTRQLTLSELIDFVVGGLLFTLSFSVASSARHFSFRAATFAKPDPAYHTYCL